MTKYLYTQTTIPTRPSPRIAKYGYALWSAARDSRCLAPVEVVNNDQLKKKRVKSYLQYIVCVGLAELSANCRTLCARKLECHTIIRVLLRAIMPTAFVFDTFLIIFGRCESAGA